MIELDKKDMEAIGAQRYSRHTIKHFLAIVFGWLVIMIVTMAVLQPVPIAVQITVLVIETAGFFYLLYRYFKKQEQYVKDLLLQCEADKEMVYRPEPEVKDNGSKRFIEK